MESDERFAADDKMVLALHGDIVEWLASGMKVEPNSDPGDYGWMVDEIRDEAEAAMASRKEAA